MPLALYGHPFSSYTQKVLIALYENNIAFEFRPLGEETPQHLETWMDRWPLVHFPMLLDGDKHIVETTIIIEYLHLNYPGPVQLIPADPVKALDVRFFDRFFDLHVMTPVQTAVNGALTGDQTRREDGMKDAIEKLVRAYDWAEQHFRKGATWATGDTFTMADCAAAPALFYADWTYRLKERHPALTAYRERLLARPSFARAVDEARQYRALFPLGAPNRD